MVDRMVENKTVSVLISSNMTSILKYCSDYGNTLFEQALISVLKKGRIPNHIAFILDGNRRYARKIGAKSTFDGHRLGCNLLWKVLEQCIQLGVCEITVYIFSIENFKRSQDEVDYLMELIEELFMDLCAKDSPVMKNDVKIQVMGELDLLPEAVLDSAKHAMEVTKNLKLRKFNVCCAYTSRNEMTYSVKQNTQMVENGELDLQDINHRTIEKHLFTSASYPLDLLVRTSGEIRLSDFLLHQATRGCQIQFIDCLWPEITLWKLLRVLLEFQIYHDSMAKVTAS